MIVCHELQLLCLQYSRTHLQLYEGNYIVLQQISHKVRSSTHLDLNQVPWSILNGLLQSLSRGWNILNRPNMILQNSMLSRSISSSYSLYLLYCKGVCFPSLIQLLIVSQTFQRLASLVHHKMSAYWCPATYCCQLLSQKHRIKKLSSGLCGSAGVWRPQKNVASPIRQAHVSRRCSSKLWCTR